MPFLEGQSKEKKFCFIGAVEFEAICVLFFTTMSDEGIQSEQEFLITLEKKRMPLNAGPAPWCLDLELCKRPSLLNFLQKKK